MYSLVFQPVFLEVQKFLKGALQKERIIFLLIANSRAGLGSIIVSGKESYYGLLFGLVLAWLRKWVKNTVPPSQIDAQRE